MFKIGALYKCTSSNPLVFRTLHQAINALTRHASDISVSTPTNAERQVLKMNHPFLVLSMAIPYSLIHEETCWKVLADDTVGWLYETSYLDFEELKE